MTDLLNEYFGSVSTGQITMGQMLLLAGMALFVFSILLSLVFAIFKVKYKPDKAKKAVEQQLEDTGRSAWVVQESQPVQSGTMVLPKSNQPVQGGTVVLPKDGQLPRTEKGTVILPKNEQ